MLDITKIDPKQIREVVYGWPPMVWMNDGLVHCVKNSNLLIRTFCEVNNIPMTERFDAWSSLSDPFLDTEFSEEANQRTNQNLRDSGFTDKEITSIRDKIEKPMLYLTAVTWEWTHYGLDDVRKALGLNLIDKLFGKSKEHMAWTSEIASRPWIREIESGKPTQTWPEYTEPEIGLENRLSYFPDLIGKKKSVKQILDIDASLIEMGKVDSAFSAALADTSKPNRFYHNERHVEEAFDLGSLSYRNLKKFTHNSSILESKEYRNLSWALLFHDSVYEPGKSDNEVLSAELAEKTMEQVGLPAEDSLKVKNLILWTQKHRMSEIDSDELKAMHDGDLGIFGLWPARYDSYCEGVKSEWLSSGEISEMQFLKGRLAFLTRFEQDHNSNNFFFALDPLHNQMARQNIHREIEQLKARIS